jgi:16S rRNA (guanine966-N2)-methyltransferase
MKIISGTLKGRTILSTKENSYRPTTGKVKEAIFSILSSGQFINEETGESVLKDATTIDLFGGTGALTFEAISRGAARGIIIENNINNVKTLELNTKRLGLQSHIQIIKASATALPPATTKCSIAFIDPPFNKELISTPIAELTNKGWLTNSALLVIESHEKEQYDLGQGYSLLFSRNYGKAVLNIYRNKCSTS